MLRFGFFLMSGFTLRLAEVLTLSPAPEIVKRTGPRFLPLNLPLKIRRVTIVIAAVFLPGLPCGTKTVLHFGLIASLRGTAAHLR